MGVGVVALLSAALVCALWLTRLEPSWWSPVDGENPEVQRTAVALENSVATLLHERRPNSDESGRGRPWTVQLRAEDANAWLQTRMERWIANQGDGFVWPSALARVQVWFHEDRINMGVELHHGERTRVLGVTVVPEVCEENALWLRAKWVHMGRLTLPASWVFSDTVAAPDPGVPPDLRNLPEARDMFAAFAGSRPIVSDSSLRLGDGRRVHLLSLRPVEGALRVTCRTDRN